MKILHVITGLDLGGAEQSLASLIETSRSHDEHAVVSLRPHGVVGALLQKREIAVLELGLPHCLSSLRGLAQLGRFVKWFRPTLIQGWMYHGNVAAWVIRRSSGYHTPVIWNICHALYDLRNEKPLTRAVIRAGRQLSHRVDAIIYNSDVSRMQHKEFGFLGNSLTIPNGFDLQRWMPNAINRNGVRGELGVTDPADRVVGHVARYHPMKDHATFLRAVALVLEQDPRVRVLLAGRGVDYSNEKLAGLISSRHRSRIHMLGERHDIERIMQALDVFCLSSWSEALPNVLGEAMSCGVPCITTDVGDCAQIVGDTGVVAPCRRPDLLAAALTMLLRKSHEEFEHLRSAARERIHADYNLEILRERYRNLYRTTCGYGLQ